MYGNQLSTADKLFGQTPLAAGQAAVIKKTYLLLGLSVLSAMVGGFAGASSPAMVRLFSGWMGWILAMVILNAVPQIAMAARNSSFWGVGALVLNGFLSGLVLAPILYIASAVAPDIVPATLALTASVFVAVTAYVMTTSRTFSAPRGLMVGIFFSIIGIMVLNSFLHIGALGMLISAGIGIFGVFILVHATSEVLRNPYASSPIPGALMLFAGLFNIFVALLHILLSLSSRD